MKSISQEFIVEIMWDQSLESCELRSYGVSHLGVVN